MKIFTVTLSAGGTAQLDATGDYYRILEAPGGAFTIATDNGDPQTVAAGIGEQTREKFARLYFYSATAQQIKIAVSDGGRVDDSRLTLTEGAVVQVDAGTLQAGFFQFIATSSALTIVTPAANVNGVRIFQALCMVTATTTSYYRFMYKASLPGGAFDTDATTIAFKYNGNNLGIDITALPLVVPAGFGIYFQQTATDSIWVSMGYELL